MTMMMKILMVGGALLILGAAGSMGYVDEMNEEKMYCSMVDEGAWPAYRPEIQCD